MSVISLLPSLLYLPNLLCLPIVSYTYVVSYAYLVSYTYLVSYMPIYTYSLLYYATAAMFILITPCKARQSLLIVQFIVNARMVFEAPSKISFFT